MKVYVVQVEELLFFSELIINISQRNKQLKLLCYFQRLPRANEILISLAVIHNSRAAILSLHACKMVSKTKLKEEISKECIATHHSEGRGEQANKPFFLKKTLRNISTSACSTSSNMGLHPGTHQLSYNSMGH